MKIIEKEITKDLLEKYKKYLYLGNYQINFNNTSILECYNDKNEVVSIAVIFKFNDEIFNEIINKDMHYLIEDNAYNEIKGLKEIVKDGGVYIQAIHSFKRNIGGATELIDYLKNKYKKLWLYSLIEAEDFWEKQNFKEIIEHVYIN